MSPGAVSDIGLPAIFGMALGEAAHEPIPCDFGDDRGAGDGVADPVATDDGRVLTEIRTPNRRTIDEGMVHRVDAPKGTGHGEVGGSENVEPVDLGYAGGTNTDGDGLLTDQPTEAFALGG